MSCDKCLREIYTNPSLNLGLAAHLALCPDCRAAYREITRLNHTARSLPTPTETVPVALRGRVLDNLPGTASWENKAAAPPLVPRRLALGIAAAVVASGVLIGPRVLVQNSFAAQMQAAVRHTQTWHFVGWRLREGKKVRWEIWGQRAPYLYREQIGAEVLLDDGKTRVRIIPPSRSRVQGMFLKTASQPLPDTQAARIDSRVPFMEGTSGDVVGRLRETRREGGFVTLQSQTRTGRIKETALLTANGESKLPVRYALQRTLDTASPLNQYVASPSDPKGAWMQAELEAWYDVPIPSAAYHAQKPSGYAYVDLTQLEADSSIPKVGSATKNGITLAGKVVERDAAGNLHLRFHGWLGNQRVEGGNLPLSLAVNWIELPYPFSHLGTNGAQEQDSAGRASEQNTAYVRINLPPVTQYSDAPEMYLVPLEPFAAGQPLPQQVDLRVGAGASIMEWEEENRSYRSTSLVNELLDITLPLPVQTQKFDYDTVTDPHVAQVGPRPTLALEAAAARALYYQIWVDARTSSPEQKRHELERGIFWFNEAIRESEKIPGGQRFTGGYRASLASMNERLERLNQTGK